MRTTSRTQTKLLTATAVSTTSPANLTVRIAPEAPPLSQSGRDPRAGGPRGGRHGGGQVPRPHSRPRPRPARKPGGVR